MRISKLTQGNIVVVQVKHQKGRNSKSFTMYDADVDEVYNRIYVMFEELEKAKVGVELYHHK